MSVLPREFVAGPDSSGASWNVEFVWLQTGVSIRHADTVDVKFFLSDGASKQEKVVALPHPDLLALSEESGHPLTDPWCRKLASLHIKQMIETGADMEKTLITVNGEQLARYATLLA